MTSGPIQNTSSFIPPSLNIPDNWEEARLVLTNSLFQMAEAINLRDIADYQDIDISTGQRWFVEGDPVKMRYGSRKVINVGALQDFSGAVANQTTAHGITTSENTRFTHIYGSATNAGASTTIQAIPLPYVDVDNPDKGIQLYVDATNVTLRYFDDYSNYDDCYVVLEWVDNT